MQTLNTIAPRELYARLAAGQSTECLDVRTPAEFAAVHIEGAQLAPLDELAPASFLRQRSQPGAPLFIICQSGVRAQKAIAKFEQVGFTGCVLVEGGTQAWVAAGLPVKRGNRQVLPLHRQVQITIGLLSAAGAALALAADPRFAIIPLFTGCGLLAAGLTDTCALAYVLAKMPWNRASGMAPKMSCTINR